MGQLATTAASNKMQQAKPQEGIKALLDKSWDRMAAVMPKHMSPERMYQLAISTINQTPKLAQCQPATVLSCLMKCSALGLEPSAVDGLGRAYILPYKTTATLIVGYRGMIDLARRSGQIKSINCHAVYKGDTFEYSLGLNEDLKHVPNDACEKTPDNLTHVYVVCHFTNGGYQLDVMTKKEVEKIRARSMSKNNGPWVTDYEAMAKKTVIRRAAKTWPMSVEAQTAIAADETDGGFVQQLVMEPLIPTEPEPPIEVEATVSDPTRRAACKSCGFVAEVYEDDGVEIADLNGGSDCCAAPDYGWVK